MAHPDEGYIDPKTILPEERDPHAKWDDCMYDPETGENFFPNDPYADRRLELIREQMQKRELVRIKRDEPKTS